MALLQSASDLAKNLYASIQKQAAPVGKAVSQVAGNAGNVVQNAIHNAAVQVTNAGNTANYNAWHSPVGQGLVAAQKFIESPQSISLPQVPSFVNRATQIPTPLGNIQPVQIARDVVNTPISYAANALSDVSQNIGRTISGQPLAQYKDLKSPTSRLGYNIGSVINPQSGGQYNVQNTPQQVIGNTAGTAQGPLSVYGGGKVLGIGKTAVENAAGQTLLDTIKKSVVSGGAISGVYGLLNGLANGRTTTLPKQLLQGATEGVQSAAGGAILGGALGAGGHTFGALRNKLSDILVQNHNIPKEQATKIVSQFARDELGKFSGVKQTPTELKQGVNDFVAGKTGKSANEPLYYSDLRKAIGLPEGGNYEGGFVNFGAKVGNQAEQGAKPVVSSTQQYLDELAGKQNTAKSTGVSGILQKGKNFLTNVKSALVDSASPIEDAVSLAEKKNNFQIRPTNDIRLQIDRVLRSKSLASQFAEDNGLTDAIKQAPDLHALDQYMIAKQASRVGELGVTTGRDAGKDAQLVKDLAPQYEPLAKQVNQYSQNLLDYSVKSGLIPQELATQLKQKYPDYVPLQRVFNELETKGFQRAGRSIASLSKQTVVQGIKGSERAIQSPIESLLLKTQDAFTQGEKNIAAKQLASYKDLPGLKGLIQEVPKGQNAPVHGFSYLDNGVKRVFQTTPEIAAAAKNLNAQQMNVVTKILSYPTRALQLGATGLNTPFAATNLLKDQIDGFISSNRAAKTSLLNPVNFMQALFSAVSHNEGYKDVIRQGGISTSFDIAREAPNLAVNQIRAGKSIGSQIAYTARNPGELLRGIENTIGRTEELTRIQNYKGQYQALIKEGRTPEDARLLAAQAARNNTANFARSGDLGKVINYVIPFFNAGIQGSRSFLRAAKQNPIQTGAKLTTSLFLPMAAATLWNTTDPNRQKIYNDIQESDKEKNIIIIPDGATQDASGKWNVIKIPLPTGLANLVSLVRRGVEQTQGGNPVQAKEVFDALVGAATPLDTSTPAKFVGGLIPQAIKPLVEGVTNTNLYTGNKIVPDSMKNLPADQQVKPNTSPLAKKIGEFTGQSPLLIEDATRTALGGVGGQLLGQNPIQQLQGRFSQATGGQQVNNQFNDINKYQQEQAVTSEKQKTAITNAATMLMDKTVDPSKKAMLINAIQQNPQLYTALKNEIRDQTQGVTSADKAVRSLSTVERAKYIKSQLQSATLDEKKKIVVDYVKKGILTPNVVQELKKQLAH